jgi:hypothetical protein
MTFYELLLTIHILSIATWFGSSMAIMVIGTHALNTDRGAFSSFAVGATAWAGKAHPAAGVLLLVTGFAMVGDADIGFEPWVVIALVGLIAAMGVGGALIGRTAGDIVKSIQANGGTLPESDRPLGSRLLTYSRIELAILVLVIADMVIKPG